jgi:thiamine kinase-like enzyme
MHIVSREILDQIPQLMEFEHSALSFKRLGGLTNLVFRVQAGERSYLLRLPGEGTEKYIDRAIEAHNAQVAAEVCVSAKIHYFDRRSGLMLADYLDGCITMGSETFKTRTGAPTRAGEIMRKLHGSGKTFEFRFELFAMIDDYLNTLSELKAELPDGYHAVVEQAEPIRQALQRHPAPLVPCHCDPLAENFLDNGERMWMVDWEYSGMNDPLWDLGDLSVEAEFSRAQDMEMLNAYCKGAVSANLFGRMTIYKAMSDLLWTLWGLVQHANNNPADDFWAYSVTRFERCKQLMNSAGFAQHIDAIE